MSLKPVEQETIDAQQEAIKEKVFGSGKYESANAVQAASLALGQDFEYPSGSKRFYRVATVPYPEGLLLNEYYMEISEARSAKGAHATARLEMLLRMMLNIMWKLSTPTGRIARLRKSLGLMGNPFLRASEGDAAALIAFFLVRRTKVNVKFHYPAMEQRNPVE